MRMYGFMVAGSVESGKKEKAIELYEWLEKNGCDPEMDLGFLQSLASKPQP